MELLTFPTEQYPVHIAKVAAEVDRTGYILEIEKQSTAHMTSRQSTYTIILFICFSSEVPL